MPKSKVKFPENDIINNLSKKKHKFTNNAIKKEYLKERFNIIRDNLPLFVDLGELKHRGYLCQPPRIAINAMRPDFKTFNVTIRYYTEDPVKENCVYKNYRYLDKVSLEEALEEARKHYTQEHRNCIQKNCPFLTNPNVWESCLVDDVDISLRDWRGTMEQLIPSYYRDPKSHMEDIPKYMLKE